MPIGFYSVSQSVDLAIKANVNGLGAGGTFFRYIYRVPNRNLKRASAASWRKLDGQPAGLDFATTFGRNSLPDADFIGEEAMPNDPHQ
jgi:hypothetical protein